MLGSLRHVWAPEGFLVSFKLETDEGLLISKVHILHHPLASCVAHQSVWHQPPSVTCGAAGRHSIGLHIYQHDLQGLFQHTREGKSCR